jgi:hypothetical protein
MKKTVLMQDRPDVLNITAATIYEGGALSPISADHLKDNIVAIKQLLNAYNLAIKQSEEKDTLTISLQSQLEHLQTSPFISIVSAIVNIIASILVGTAINLLTAEKPNTANGYLLLTSGAILILVASLSTILYPYVREWFNKKK